MGIVKFILRVKEDIERMCTEMEDAASTGEFYIQYGAFNGYFGCLENFIDKMFDGTNENGDIMAVKKDEFRDICSELYAAMSEIRANKLNVLSENPQTEKSMTERKPPKQPPVDRDKLLIGMEVCRQEIACEECPYHNYGPCKTEIINDALSYICYLEEQLKEARDGT